MKKFGLIGYPLGHSFSEKYFATKFRSEGITDYQYDNYPIPSIEALEEILADDALRGFNVTIPYKQAILPYLSYLDPEAAEVGAVNCVKITERGLSGYNTDVYGFEQSLLSLLGTVRPESAFVLGTGGASKAVAYVLKKIGIQPLFVSRRRGENQIGYDELSEELISRTKLIVNSTPLGTYPDVDQCPDIPYQALTPEHYLFDLVYNPALTRFLQYGQQHGATICNGYDMLVGQAEKAWQIWNE